MRPQDQEGGATFKKTRSAFAVFITVCCLLTVVFFSVFDFVFILVLIFVMLFMPVFCLFSVSLPASPCLFLPPCLPASIGNLRVRQSQRLVCSLSLSLSLSIQSTMRFCFITCHKLSLYGVQTIHSNGSNLI